MFAAIERLFTGARAREGRFATCKYVQADWVGGGGAGFLKNFSEDVL